MRDTKFYNLYNRINFTISVIFYLLYFSKKHKKIWKYK